MPKTAIDYSKSCVYRLIYNDITYYVGSTTNMRQRKSAHKKISLNENRREYNYPLYEFMRNNGGFDNWTMVMIQAYPECQSSDELRMYERYHYDILRPVLNVNRPIVTKEEVLIEAKERSRISRLENPSRSKKWRDNNVEHVKAYRIQYRNDNADKIQEYNDSHRQEKALYGKIYREVNADKLRGRDRKRGLCECGCEINLRGKSSHKKSKKHIDRMTAINNEN
jgi:Zn ribbon nucleic-acid-binding protein